MLVHGKVLEKRIDLGGKKLCGKLKEKRIGLGGKKFCVCVNLKFVWVCWLFSMLMLLSFKILNLSGFVNKI